MGGRREQAFLGKGVAAQVVDDKIAITFAGTLPEIDAQRAGKKAAAAAPTMSSLSRQWRFQLPACLGMAALCQRPCPAETAVVGRRPTDGAVAR